MRIQHNIMAMNAYRNYNNNNKALSGNLEKLSSGYKINRAGDDAAGLAISEKMRAQITGLNAASKNVKDGISLVKTAEGAMQEIQDMLNRMDYLATQSANGTYQDEVDREALQKEVNQLNEEINRIAESANFNGIKLLDGTWDADAKVRAVNSAQKALDTANAALAEASKPVTVAPVYSEVASDKLIKDGVVLPEKAPGSTPVVPGGPNDVGTNTVLETNAVEGVKPSFEVTLNGTNHVMTGDGTGANPAQIDLEVDGTKVTITEADITNTLGAKKAGDKISATDLAKVFEAKINGQTNGTAGGNIVGTLANGDFVGTTDADLVWNVKADGEKLVFSLNAEKTDPNKLANNLNEHYNVTMKAGATDGVVANPVTGEEAATKATFETGAISYAADAGGAADGNSKATVTYTDKAGTEKTVDVEFVTSTDLATTEGNLKDALAANADLAALFDISLDATTHKITMTAKEAGTGKGAVTNIAIAATGGNEANKDQAGIAAGTKTDAADAYVPGTTGYTNYGTVNVKPGTPAKPNQLANTVIDLSKLGIVDGTKITLGKTEYTFAVGKNSAINPKGENVIDLTKFEKITDTGALESAATQMSQIKNDIFSVGHATIDGKVTIQQLEKDGKHVEEGKMTTMDDLMKYIKVENADAAKTAEAQKAADAEQAEKKAAAEAQVAAAKKQMTAAEAIEGGKALNLQIGDTSDNYNQLGVKIGSMKTTALGVDGLSIATAEDAAAAIDTVKAAINYVSSVRGDLGAYQNRLDHTANNLSVMAENIQDAESSIRDTDVAEEMMSYVKNNILVQSAQAMLAQANQVPQGVLQLLG